MTITLRENQHLIRGKDIPEDDFDALLRIVSAEGNSRGILEFYTDGNGCQYLKARNYVGLVSFSDGNALEIVPKYHGVDSMDDTKRILLDMLSVVYRLPVKKHGKANLGLYKSNPFEFFITLFLDDVENIVRKGLRSSYQEYAGNENFVRGRINFTENLKKNMIHLERFYVEYEIYGPDRSENRLIKATLLFLKKVSTDSENFRRIRTLIPFFDNVGCLGDLDTELRGCIRDRNMKDYEDVIRWCNIFLRGNNLTIFSGSNVSYTFLLPMEKVFESYVAEKFISDLSDLCEVSVQDTENKLFDCCHVVEDGISTVNKSSYLPELRPDIVVRSEGLILIFDTKWKNITDIRDMSSSDLYQMYSYATRYGCHDIMLLYPAGQCREHVFSDTRNNVRLWVKFVDLQHMDKTMSEIRSFISECVLKSHIQSSERK